MRILLRGEEIQKLKSGDGKDLEEFELYLPVLSYQIRKVKEINYAFVGGRMIIESGAGV